MKNNQCCEECGGILTGDCRNSDCSCHRQPQKPEEWEKNVENLREEFEELFPKDQEAIDGIRPSKSNRSAGLVLWAKWHIILEKALSSERQKVKDLIVKEINIARSEGEKTSRLTSLYNKLGKEKEECNCYCHDGLVSDNHNPSNCPLCQPKPKKECEHKNLDPQFPKCLHCLDCGYDKCVDDDLPDSNLLNCIRVANEPKPEKEAVWPCKIYGESNVCATEACRPKPEKEECCCGRRTKSMELEYTTHRKGACGPFNSKEPKSEKQKEDMKQTRNSKVLNDFIEYCSGHPTQRFWQALRNWSGADYVNFVRGTWELDTFYWENKDEFDKTVDEE